MNLNFPQDCYYDRANHMWVRQEIGDKRLLIGIDALGLESLGDLAYIVLPQVGTRVTRDRPSGTLEAAKMTGELIAPVSGTIVARNDNILRTPSLVNHDNYGQGWLLAIEPSDWQKESAELVHGSELDAWVNAEVKRYHEQGWIHAS